MADLGNEEFKMKRKRLVFFYVQFDWVAGLTACHFARQTGINQQLAEVEKIINQLEHLRRLSKWNMENKYQLLKAECHYARGEIPKASQAYDDSIKAAKNHKFIHEMALGCELAGYFYKEQGDEERSQSMFKDARDAYIKWGANRKAHLIPL